MKQLGVVARALRRCSGGGVHHRFALRRTGADRYEVTVAGQRQLEHNSLDGALQMLDARIRLFIAASARDWLFVHAGVVAWGRRALVLPGPSFSGKTTLVRALVGVGATYYSDEYAVLDKHGRVHPYPRRLSIRGDDDGPARARPMSDPRGIAATGTAELGVVILTRYRAGAEWGPRRVSTGRGLVALLANTVPARERPKEALRTLGRAVTGATVLEGDRGEADLLASTLLDELAGAGFH